MSELSLREIAEELTALKMNVEALSKKIAVTLAQSKFEEIERLTPENELKDQSLEPEQQSMHAEAKALKAQVQGYVDAFMKLGLCKHKALESALNYCGVKCAFDSYDM